MLIQIVPRKSDAADPAAPREITIHPLRVSVPSRPLRVLDLDCEARPLHWIANDYVSKEITAIAWAWTDAPKNVSCVLLGEMEPVEMLQRFVAAYNQADVVTGHFITGFDLPLLNGAMTEYGLPALRDTMASDTKTHLTRRHGLSGSQENIGAMLHLEHAKVKMNQATWRAANRLTKAGLALARQRVTGDVQQHIEMRAKLIELGYLGPPRRWKSGSAKAVAYEP